MIRKQFLLRLLADNRGGAIMEFALLGPTLITMLIGVLQIGLAMQAYNAMRAASSDLARYATVERQKGNTVSTTSLTTQARSIATASPYMLLNANLATATVTQAATQRVSGATEYSVQYNYNVPNFLQIISLPTIGLSYSRPIFVVT